MASILVIDMALSFSNQSEYAANPLKIKITIINNPIQEKGVFVSKP